MDYPGRKEDIVPWDISLAFSQNTIMPSHERKLVREEVWGDHITVEGSFQNPQDSHQLKGA